MRRVLNEVGSEIPDMNALTQLLKFKLGFADLAEPTPEILKNYMDVSNSPSANHPPTAADPSAMPVAWLSLLGVPILGGWWDMPALPSHHSQESERGRDVGPVGEIHAPLRLGGWLPKVAKLKILILIIKIINNPLPPKWELCSFCDLFPFPFVTKQ